MQTHINHLNIYFDFLTENITNTHRLQTKKTNLSCALTLTKICFFVNIQVNIQAATMYDARYGLF